MGGEYNNIYTGSGAPDTMDYGNGDYDDGTGGVTPRT